MRTASEKLAIIRLVEDGVDKLTVIDGFDRHK